MSRDAREEGFLGRWSRLKTDARETQAQPLAEAAAPVEAKAVDEPPPELPPVDTLTIDSDFRGFLHPKVDEDLRRTALRKLFSDPHFNVMDGLDVYIDDYSVSEPIPAAMLAGMKQAQRILRWAEGKDDEEREGEPDEERVEREENEAPAEIADGSVVAAPADGTLIASAADDPPPAAAQAADALPQAVAKPA